ncbi:MAG: hypothetical protein ACHBN1_02645 [Heteroscytonema crispum UTEX LB 1556]
MRYIYSYTIYIGATSTAIQFVMWVAYLALWGTAHTELQLEKDLSDDVMG